MYWPVVGDRHRDRGVDRCRVVMAVVADGTIAAHIDPRASRAHLHVAAHRRGTGRRQGREISRRLRKARQSDTEPEGKRGQPEQAFHHHLRAAKAWPVAPPQRLTAPAGLYPEGVMNTTPAAIGIDAPPDVAEPTSLTYRIADELLATR